MAMTLALATLKSDVSGVSDKEMVSIFQEKILASCPSAKRVERHDGRGVFIPCDKQHGCWIEISDNGVIELGESAA